MNLSKSIKDEFIMGVLDMIRGETQSRKTLNDKEQRIFDVLIKCSGVYCYGEEMRSKSKTYLPYVSLWDLALERHTILYELISGYRKCVSEYGIDVCRYEREYNIKKINVEYCYNNNWDSSLGLNDEVCKDNKIAKDIKNDIEWLRKELKEDPETRKIVLTLVKYGLN